MGCYGIGPSRLIGAIVEIFHDDNGIIWPETVAPFKVHLIDIKQKEKADEIYRQLSGAGVEVLYDDRDVSAGIKFADADLIGIPYRVVVSEKTIAKGSVEVKNRKTRDIEMIEMDKLIEFF